MEIEAEEQMINREFAKPNIAKLKEMSLPHYKSKEFSEYLTKLTKRRFGFDIDVLKYLAKGGSSYIYETKIKSNEKSIVVKVINDEKYKNLNEPKLLSILKHKNVITVYGYYYAKNEEEFIVMEKGRDLKSFGMILLKRVTLTETFLCYITVQILEGLSYLYKCNVIHYDIKPGNIIIDDYLNVKLIDFSASLIISEKKDSYINAKYRGTQFFMAPEVIKREKIKVSDYHKIDLFSLGVTLYTLAFGFYPFNLEKNDGENDNIIYQKITSDWKAENIGTEFSGKFLDFLNCLLEKDINKRIDINNALNHYWIKGAKILFDEKEKINNANAFLTSLITDNFFPFNEYIYKYIK